MRKILKLFPRQFQQFDHWLLLNKPKLWETQLHLVAVYSLMFLMLGLGIACFVPINMASLQRLADFPWEWLFMPLPIILLPFWIYTQYAFQSERDFAKMEEKDIGNQFRCYLLVFLLASLPALLPLAVLDYRMANIVTYNELTQDGDDLNYAQVFFPLPLNDGDDFYSYSLNYYNFMAGEKNCCFQEFPFPVGSGSSRERVYGPQDITKDSLQKRIQDPKALNHISKYLGAMKKYLPEEHWQISPEQALATFKEGTASYPMASYEALSIQLQTIKQLKQNGWHENLLDIGSLVWISLLFTLSNIALALRYIKMDKVIIILSIGALSLLGLLGIPMLYNYLRRQWAIQAETLSNTFWVLLFGTGLIWLIIRLAKSKQQLSLQTEIIRKNNVYIEFLGHLLIVAVFLLVSMLASTIIGFGLLESKLLTVVVCCCIMLYVYPPLAFKYVHKRYEQIRANPSK